MACRWLEGMLVSEELSAEGLSAQGLPAEGLSAKEVSAEELSASAGIPIIFLIRLHTDVLPIFR